MIEGYVKAEDQETRLLEFVRGTFLVLCSVGFVFYGADIWMMGHFAESWQSQVPFYVSAVGLPVTLAMLLWRGKWIRYPFLLVMAISVLTGLIGTFFHLQWNAQDAEVSLWSISGFIESFEGSRPVLAAMAYLNIGAVGLIIGLTIKDKQEKKEQTA